MEDESTPKEKTPQGWHKFWDKEKVAAQKRLREFTDRGNKIVERFVDERVGNSHRTITSRLNLFHTNIATLKSMLYGQKPKIDVAREHQDPDDDIARVASNLYQRILEADNDKGPTALKAALLDRLLPGLGAARVRYTFDNNGDIVLDESADVEYVHWQDFLWGWGRTWTEVPWIGFRSWMTKDEAAERFGAEVAKSLQYKNQLPTGDDEGQYNSNETDQRNNVQKAEIWEFWDKNTEKVFWYSEGTDIILDSQDDPLQLDRFWPMPHPMMANLTTTLFEPTADFVLAQDLYNQIDELYTRVNIIVRAIKVVGVYDKSAGDSVGRMLKEGIENDLIPVDNWAMFAEKGALKGVIDWFPVETVVGTLQTLREVLAQQIQLLYEVTGMSDVLRGANTDQYTSDGTNQLKAKFGSIRVQCLQDEFAKFASDLEALRAEIIAKHFSPQTIIAKSSALFLPQADKHLLGPALQLMQSQEARWRIDIRPESIAIVDHAQLKNERVEYLTAMSTYIQSAQAMAKAMPESLPILLEFLKFGMAGFRGADYMEGILDQAIDGLKKQPPQSQEGGAEQAKLQVEQLKLQGQQMKAQAELQKVQAKAQADAQNLQLKIQGELAKIQADSQADQSLERIEAMNEMQKIAADLQADLKSIQANMQADLTVERAQAAYDIESQQIQHQNNLVELRTNAQMAPNKES